MSLNIREQAFVDGILEGKSATQAYKDAGYKARGHSAETMASRLLSKVEVKETLEKERERLSEEGRMRRWELIDHLQKIIMTPVGEINEMSPLAAEYNEYVGEKSSRTVIKTVSKMDAIKQLVQIMGWNAPEKVQVDATDGFAKMLMEIRARKS